MQTLQTLFLADCIFFRSFSSLNPVSNAISGNKNMPRILGNMINAVLNLFTGQQNTFAKDIDMVSWL